MSYTALYRKFRPNTFEAVKGQTAVVTTLKNQIKAGRIGHAYLFCGTRGTGKTTVSKIFAKAVNCEHPVDGNPCGICTMCKVIGNQTSMNVIEIDAASNNGVDNIREIVEEVKYSPTEGKYKVYIIDEVHMLSAGAFNALLKTLEEPPSYVIFILATTEVHKIPVTILSRCQRYDFKRITIEDIVECLKELIEKEGIEAEEKALRYVARAADGAMRDALSLLEECISFYLGQKLTYDNVLEVLGKVDIEVFARFHRDIIQENVVGCINLLEELVTSGRDLYQFTIDFTWYFRNLLLLKASDEMADLLEVSTDQQKLLQQEAKTTNAETLMRYIRIFSDLSNQIKFAVQKRVLVEVALIKLCRPEMERDYDSLTERVQKLEEKLKHGVISVSEKTLEENDNITEQKELLTAIKEDIYDKSEFSATDSEGCNIVIKAWNKITAKTHPLIKIALMNAKCTQGAENEIVLLFNSEMDLQVVNKEQHLKEIEDIIFSVIGEKMKVVTKLQSSKEVKAEETLDLKKIFKGVPIEFEN